MALNDRGNILKVLRTLMRSGGMASSYNRSSSTEPGRDPFHALIVPTADAHGSEYIASCDARREFITNFTGSSGTAVVTLKEAALWTDGRYFLQADAQLDKCHWIMMKDRQPETPTVGEWLNKCLASGSRIGADPYTLSYDEWIKLEKELSQSGNVLTSTPVNLIDEIWSRRPPRPAEPVLPLNMSFTGKRWQDKIESIRNEMTHKEAAILVLTALDDIAWLFNLRGSDIPFNPVFFAYAIISMDKVYLFIDDSKLSSSALAHLQTNNGLDDPMDTMSSSSSSERSTPSSVVPNVGNDGTNRSSPSPQQMVTNCSTGNNNRSCEVEIRSYDLVADFIRSYIAKNSTGRVWISNQSSYALVNLIPESRRIITRVSPVALQKSVKNSVEIGGMRRAHIKDAVALCEFFAWLEDEIVNHGHHHGRSRKVSNPAASPSSTSSGSSSLSSGTSSSIIDELAVDAKLEEFRRQQDDYMGPSFQTIAGVGPNSAIIHYQSKEETNRPITTDEIFLLDTGAQFRDGTTDITRTVHFGTPTAHERECLTRVVKGHISLATARFPRLIVGQLLDSYARRSLWDVGLDYNHGTGHGVGSFLNVHEGPSSISNRTNPNDSGIVEDMVFSNEPGYYESGNFGIRIESLVITKKIDLKFNFNDRGYLGFETITLVPIQTKLLDPSLMTREEIEWIDQYHQQCRDIVGKELEQQGRTRALQWLIKETEPMEK